VDPRKENLLLVNKADMLTEEQRQAWANYFEEAGIAYKFFSASLAKEMNEARDFVEGDEEEEENEQGADNYPNAEEQALTEETSNIAIQNEEVSEDDEEHEASVNTEDERTRILTVDELDELFLQHVPENQGVLKSDIVYWIY
jgi:large subunit GTPase 1